MSYASDGSLNVTVVAGSSYTGIYAFDGSINVILSPGNTYVGAYHPCGAWWISNSTPPSVGALPIRAPDGSLYVSISPYTYGTQKVTVVSGSIGSEDYLLGADSADLLGADGAFLFGAT